MAQQDRRGLPLSTGSDTAAARYRDGVDRMLSSWHDTGAVLDEAIAADPDFALAHAARARVHALRAEPAAARASIAKASELVAQRGTERERSHVDVLSLLIHGQAAKGLDRALAHLQDWPRDAVILSLPLGAFGLFAFSGMADHDQARVDLCERHAAAYEAGDWWFLTYRGWSHTENGAVAHGRALTERGFEKRNANANAVHALAHAMFEGGDGPGAEALIAGWLPGYDRTGTLHGHIAWHAAIVALEQGDTDGALAVYQRHVQASASAGLPINIVTDSAAFLWRLQAHGNAVPAGAWEAAAAYAAGVFPKAGLPFVDAHMAVLDAAIGDRAAVETRAAALAAMVEAGTLPHGPVAPAICRASLAFAEGDYAGCVRILEPLAGEVVRIGGSGAQRQLQEEMLLLALMRSGEAAKARALLDRRLHRRPSARDAGWLAGPAA